MTSRRGLARRLAVACVCVCLPPGASAVAQPAASSVDVRVSTTDGSPPTGAAVDVLSETDARVARSAQVRAGSSLVSLPAPAPLARVRVSLAGFQPVECLVTTVPGGVALVEVRLSPVDSSAASTAIDRDRLLIPQLATFGRPSLERLPGAETAWSLLETTHPFLIADRIDGGGLWPGEGARLAGEQGASAAQTTFSVDGHEVNDPLLAGLPSIDPQLAAVETVAVQSAALEASTSGAGPAVTLMMRRPSDAWSGSVSVRLAPPALQSRGGSIPPIARMRSGGDGDASAGGPLTRQWGVFVAGRAARTQRIDLHAEEFTPAVGSATAHVVAAGRDTEFRTLVTALRADRPFIGRERFADRTRTQRDGAVALHADLERWHGGSSWTIGAALQRATSAAAIVPDSSGGIVERLVDGPPLALVTAADTSRAHWEVAGGFTSRAIRWRGADHIVRVGGSLGQAGVASRGGAQPPFGELVNGVPARVWDVAFRGDESHHRATSANVFASDRIALSDRLTLVAAIRADVDRGSADGATSRIRWFTATPRATMRWRPADSVVVTGSYAQFGHRLPLAWLAVGDPSGPAGVMSRWDDRDGNGQYGPSELTAVAAVGNCCTGAGPAVIDEHLQRPVTTEFRLGVEHSIGAWRWSLTGRDRRERHLAAIVNTGVTAADYVMTSVDDPGVDLGAAPGPLPVFDRRPSSFLQDAYLLTSDDEDRSRHQGLELVLGHDTGAWLFRLGGSAYRSEGVGASRGYHAGENDQGLPGEFLTNPNAATNARGRLFYDRAFVIKALGGYQGAGPLGAWFIARYQDGQPFARAVVAEGLNQGAEFVQAYPRGGQRFTFTFTLDARVALQWRLGRHRKMVLAFEAFNLPNTQLEVEEDIATGPAFRTVTAVQPPRVMRIGLEFAF